MSKLNLSKVISRVEGKVGLVHASLIDSKPITDDLYKVVLSFSSEGHRDQRYQAVAKLFQGNARPVEGSFREIAGSYKRTAVGFVSKNQESKMYTKEMASSGRYKQIAGSNALLDTEDDSLWEITSSGDDKFIVRNGKEDLSELVSLASMRSPTFGGKKITCGHLLNNAFNRDYIAYVHPRRAEIAHGYIVESYMDENENEMVEVLDQESVEPIEINPELIVESATFNGDDAKTLPKEVVAKYDLKDSSSLKEYYAKMFSYSPDYIEKVNKIIDGRSYV